MRFSQERPRSKSKDASKLRRIPVRRSLIATPLFWVAIGGLLLLFVLASAWLMLKTPPATTNAHPVSGVRALLHHPLATLYQTLGGKSVVLKNVYLTGQHHTSSEAVIHAMQVKIGQPLFSIDIHDILTKLLTIPWIEHAVVTRVLPDSLRVTIQERIPIAVWQHQGKLQLIDSHGTIFRTDDMRPFTDKLLLVGENAPSHLQALLVLLNLMPELKDSIKSAVWLGDRRWNLRFQNGLDVKLPEQDTDKAILQLLVLHRKQPLQESGIRSIDMRIKGKIYVK
jgi:cell division protein FtsQ